MAQVGVTINGRQYPVTCEAGQEDHVARLADYVNEKVTTLAKNLGQVGDARLLVLASLLVANELSDALSEAAALRGDGPVNGERAGLTASLETAAAKIEAIVARLERP